MASGSSSVPDLPQEETQALLSLFSEDITEDIKRVLLKEKIRK